MPGCISDLSFFCGFRTTQSSKPVDRKSCYPVGLDTQQPRFSWKLVSDKRNVLQTAYEIKVLFGKSTIWGSGRVAGDQSVFVPYGGPGLHDRFGYV